MQHNKLLPLPFMVVCVSGAGVVGAAVTGASVCFVVTVMIGNNNVENMKHGSYSV